MQTKNTNYNMFKYLVIIERKKKRNTPIMVISVYPETETHLCLTIIGIITFKKKKIAKILDQIFTSWQSKPDSVSTDTDKEIIEIRQVSNHYSPKDIFNLDKCWFFFFLKRIHWWGIKCWINTWAQEEKHINYFLLMHELWCPWKASCMDYRCC